jgi:Xaa-Pro aminopeptidase
VLIDAGAEYRGYASDITRTFPVNGRFSAEQRALHDLVGDAQAAALAQARPGVPYEAGHEAAVQTLTEGLLRLGLLKGTLQRTWPRACTSALPAQDRALDRAGRARRGRLRAAGDSRLLEPGMAFTIEPGLYIGVDDTTVEPRWRGIGIRTEDDVLITDDGHRVLTEGLARSADEIEAVMAG